MAYTGCSPGDTLAGSCHYLRVLGGSGSLSLAAIDWEVALARFGLQRGAEEESAMIERAAESSGVSKSDYARKLVIEQARMDVAAIDAGEVPGKVVRHSSLADQLLAVASQLALVAESARRLSRTGN